MPSPGTRDSRTPRAGGDPARRRPRLTGRRLGLSLGLVAGIGLLVGCTNFGYYTRALVGGAKVLTKRRAVEKVIADDTTDPALRRQLELALEIRDFASSDLLLPDNESYRKYADLGRPYAVWNVVAAPELSVEAHTWCFVIVGCVTYRGYFSERRAEDFAGKLRREGYDVDVGGVVAYSTAGWFADPLLNTFIQRPEPHLAGLIFHELAHQVVYIKDDTTFNESLAMTIEEEGALRWLVSRGRQGEIESYRLYKRRERQFTELVFAYRDRLRVVYEAEATEDWKRRRKAEVLAELRAVYEEMRESWDGWPGFDGWFERDPNNARLALIGVYHQQIPAFRELLERHAGRLEPFYEEVREIAALDPSERDLRMRALMRSSTPLSGRSSAETEASAGPAGSDDGVPAVRPLPPAGEKAPS